MAERELSAEISEEGRQILGFVEALPKESRRELAAMVELLCRSQGYHSLQDNVVELERERERRVGPARESASVELAEVIQHPRWRKK